MPYNEYTFYQVPNSEYFKKFLNQYKKFSFGQEKIFVVREKLYYFLCLWKIIFKFIYNHFNFNAPTVYI